MLTGYNIFNLKAIIEEVGEQRAGELLLDFSCSRNPEVEDFLRHKAIEFSKQSIARTHLVYASHQGKPVLIGYFSLSAKSIMVCKKALSSNLRQRIVKFGTYNRDLDRYLISAPLIGQLGKNETNNYGSLITGNELLKMACDKVAAVQYDVGGKIVYLECEDHEKLNEFYKRNGFVNFGRREIEGDESTLLRGRYLNQMLKYLD